MMTETGRLTDVQLLELRLQLGNRIRQLRDEREWSQDAFAHLAGLGRSYPNKIEVGKIDVQFSTLARIAHTLGVSLSELLSDVGNVSEPTL